MNLSSRPSPSRIPLCVPYWDETEALAKGALYDPAYGFYVPGDAFLDNVWVWLPRMYARDGSEPALLPDMLPVTTWEQNVRHLFGEETWDRMRKHAYKAAGFRCEVCGARGKLEAHEDFILENETGVQRLDKILCLCVYCHKARHLGIARRLGILSDVKAHMRAVNGWSQTELEDAIADAYDTWLQRCDWSWTVDVSYLYRSGYINA